MDGEGGKKRGKSLAVIIANKIPLKGRDDEGDDDGDGEGDMSGLRSAMGDLAQAMKDGDRDKMAEIFMEAVQIASGMEE